jgi:hypothetical protein
MVKSGFSSLRCDTCPACGGDGIDLLYLGETPVDQDCQACCGTGYVGGGSLPDRNECDVPPFVEAHDGTVCFTVEDRWIMPQLTDRRAVEA